MKSTSIRAIWAVVLAIIAAFENSANGEPLAGFKVEGERWTYQDDNLSMRGILLKPEGTGPFPGVLISHGLGGSSQSFGMSKAREMVKWGLVCLACDYAHAAMPGKKLDTKGEGRQHFGASEENLKRASKCLDILASLPEVDAKKLCAYGHSMGGFVTIGLAAKEPNRLLAAAISGSGIAREGFAAPSAEAAGKVKTPIIIFHGAEDTTARPAQSLALKEILDRNSVANERHVYEGVGHTVDQQKPQEVSALMRKWFHKYGVVAVAEGEGAAPPDVTAQVQGKAKGTAKAERAANVPPEWVREKIEARNSQFKTFKSSTIGGDVSYVIYLPAGYEKSPTARFPVMYWLHGIGGAQTGVPRLVERFDDAITAGKTPPMLVVFVNGVRDSFYCDTHDGKIPVETVIIQDLIPHIDATYRTMANREGRLIEGFSMGGFGAAHLGFKYPELFGSVSMIDAALVDLSTIQGRHAALYERIFGGQAANFQAENPRLLVEKNADAIRGKTAVRLAVGPLLAGNRSFHEQLEKLNIAHDYDVFDVSHNHGEIYDGLGDKNWGFYRRAFAGIAK